MRDVERARDAPYEDVIQLLAREIARHLVQDVHHLAPALGLAARALQLLFGAAERRARVEQLAARAQLHAHAREQVAHVERLRDHIGGAEREHLRRDILRRLRRHREHGHVAPMRIAGESLQHGGAIAHGRRHIQQEQIGVHRAYLLEHALHHAAHDRDVIALLLQQPGERAGEQIIIVGDQDPRLIHDRGSCAGRPTRCSRRSARPPSGPPRAPALRGAPPR